VNYEDGTRFYFQIALFDPRKVEVMMNRVIEIFQIPDKGSDRFLLPFVQFPQQPVFQHVCVHQTGGKRVFQFVRNERNEVDFLGRIALFLSQTLQLLFLVWAQCAISAQAFFRPKQAS
jgi:hypothetical protein